MKKTAKVILGSAMTMAMCASLIAGSTLALFSTKSETDIAITSAKVDVKATIENLTTGSVLPGDDNSYKALGSAQVVENGLEVGNFTPGDYVTFDVAIKNESTIPVKWQLSFAAKDENSKSLYDTLTISATGVELVDTGSIELSKWQSLAAGEDPAEKLTVKIEMPTKNEDMSVSGTLSAVVYAVQGNAVTVDPVPAEKVDPNTVYVYDLAGLKQFAADVADDTDAHFAGKTVYLMENIDLGNDEWEPIAEFHGTFDGNNQIISNLKVNRPNADDVGFFSNVPAGNLKNVVLDNVDVKGQKRVAALAGNAFNLSSIDNITVRGNIKVEGSYQVGAVTGYSYTKVTNCTVSGLAGSYVKGVYKASPDECEGDNIGGVIGYHGELNNLTDTIVNCHVSGVTVSGTRKVGGVVGYLHHGCGIVNSSFENGTVACNASDSYITQKGIAMIAVGGIVGQTHYSEIDASQPAPRISNNHVNNITIEAPNSFTFVTATSDQTLTSAILGNARSCDTDAGRKYAANIQASGNTEANVRYNAQLNGVKYGNYNTVSPYITDVTVHSVQDILNIHGLQAQEATSHVFGHNNAGENRTNVNFVAGVYDLGSVAWSPLNGYRYNYVANGDVTIKNMNMQASQWRGGFVDSAADCTIKGFTFENGTLIGEQVGVVAGHADSNGVIENVTLKGNFEVAYGGKAVEGAPGIGVFFGVITSASDSIKNVTVAEGCTVELNLNNIVPDPSLKFVDDDYLMGYGYNEAPVSGSLRSGVHVNGYVYVNVVDGLRQVVHNDNKFYFEASTPEGYVKFVDGYTNSRVGTNFRTHTQRQMVLHESRFRLNITHDLDFTGKDPVAPIGEKHIDIDGHGNTISNITFGHDSVDKSGLVALTGCTISNLTLCNVTASGAQVGAFIGQPYGATLENCRLEGNVNITYVDYSDNTYPEDWPALGLFTGMSVAKTTFKNVVLAKDAVATLDFGGNFNANAGSSVVDFLVGYKTSDGSIVGAPVNEGANVTVTGLGDLNTTGDGIYVDADADIVIDGGAERMSIEFERNAFTNPAVGKLEGIASGKIVIKNVDFKGNALSGSYAMTLAPGFVGEIVFENCTFDTMYCAVYCNGRDGSPDGTAGNAHIVFKDCTFKNMAHVYGINHVEDLWNNNVGIRVEFQTADGNTVAYNELDPTVTNGIDEHNDPNKPGE